MKTVRGYFDDFFAGKYLRTISEGKRAVIEVDADAKCTVEIGK
jgi:hypothetical protein